MTTSRDHWNQVAFNNAERAWLTPPDDEEGVLFECEKCGKALFAGDYVYEDFDGKKVCDDCIDREVEERREELEEPEPDWDDMPGGADHCNW